MDVQARYHGCAGQVPHTAVACRGGATCGVAPLSTPYGPPFKLALPTPFGTTMPLQLSKTSLFMDQI